MRNLALFATVLLAFSFTACAQPAGDQDVPENVKAAFAQRFPGANGAKWEMEDATSWEAEFRMNGKPYSAVFTTDAVWLETEHEIRTADIPAGIKAILDANFADYEIEEAEMAETAAGIAYEFEIEQGEESFEVAIDPQGVLTKKQANEDDEDDGEE